MEEPLLLFLQNKYSICLLFKTIPQLSQKNPLPEQSITASILRLNIITEVLFSPEQTTKMMFKNLLQTTTEEAVIFKTILPQTHLAAAVQVQDLEAAEEIKRLLTLHLRNTFICFFKL
jgi:hypothetical protein